MVTRNSRVDRSIGATSRRARRFGIALFDGVEELDWVGPWEVLTYWKQLYPVDGVDVFTLGRSADLVTCAKGARVIPDFTWDEHPPIDVLIFPGGDGTRAIGCLSANRDYLASPRAGSGCTG